MVYSVLDHTSDPVYIMPGNLPGASPTMAPPPAGNQRKLALAVTLLVLAAGIFWFVVRPSASPFADIAYPYLPMDTVTTDPTQCIMVAGHDSPPAKVTLADGREAFPVFSHPDPAVVSLVDGRVLYFPAHLIGEAGLTTPPLPPRNKPLAPEHRFKLVQYLPDAVRERLKTALQGAAP